MTFKRKLGVNLLEMCLADLGKVELQRIICRQRDYQPPGQVLWEGIAMVAEKQAVIAERRHGDANLSQVIQILQHRSLEH